jgi:hypothetical protein
MAKLKTVPTHNSVQRFLEGVEPEQKREDGFAILEIMKQATKQEPVMWGNIVGFGRYHYKGASGREGDWFLAGFSPRKQNLTVYIHAGFEQYDELRQKLGKIKGSKSCLYINRLSDVHVPTLKKLIRLSARHPAGTNAPV